MTAQHRFGKANSAWVRLLGVAALATVTLLGVACSIDANDPVGGGGSSAAGSPPAAGTSSQLPSGGTASSAGGPSQSAGTGTNGGTPGSAGQPSSGGQASMAGMGMGGAGGAAGAAHAGAGGTSSGGSAQGGSGGSAQGSGGPGAWPIGNPPVLSAGCGKDSTVTSGKKTIKSTNQDRTYIIDIPSGYDKNKPYRLFYTSHWIGSTSEAVRDQNYYFLKPLATAANQPAIFVAPQSDGSTWQQKDHALFDDILAYVKANLCIDESRVFATGFSFGGMITYSLSVNHQKDIRAAVGIAPANYNIYVPANKSHAPIAWMQTTGMSDGTCPWIQGTSTTNGAKFIAIEHATDNSCMVPTDIPIWKQGNHVCYDFMGCKAGYPTKVCTFNGDHTNINNEGGTNWIPVESWKFFTQF